MKWFRKKKEPEAKPAQPRPIRWCDKCGYQQWPERAVGFGVDRPPIPASAPFKIKYIASKNHLRFECPTCGAFECEATLAQRDGKAEKVKRELAAQPEA